MNGKSRMGISNSTLKLIAISSMFVDHFALILYYRYCISVHSFSGEQYDAYCVMRLIIGRIAFPIFCFLLTEGFLRTSDLGKYLLRMGIFALVSEVPFDLAVHLKVWEPKGQNVFFTLFLGLLMMTVLQKISGTVKTKWLKIAAMTAASAFFIVAAQFLRTDYGGYGICLILAFYLFQQDKKYQMLAAGVAMVAGDFLWGMHGNQFMALLSLIPISFYHGRKGFGGKTGKYFAYLFYPFHLLLLWWLGSRMQLY